MDDSDTNQPLPEITRQVIAAIGEDNPDADWALKPTDHIASFPNPMLAAPLIEMLKHKEINDLLPDFEKADKAANTARDLYKKWGKREIFATMIATILGAFVLLQPVSFFAFPIVKGITVLIQFSALALVFLAAWWLKRQSYMEEWQRQRGQAEIRRVVLFDKLMTMKAAGDLKALPILPLKLEYFRRYQLNMQQRYYKERGAEHAKGAKKSLVWRWFSRIIYIIAILLTIPAAILLLEKLGWISLPWLSSLIKTYPVIGLFSQMADKSLLGIGVITSAIHGATTARTRMDMDERNAARYKITSKNLDFLATTKLPLARKMAAEGNEVGVQAFINEVQRQISTEHREWVLLSKIESEKTV